MLGLLVSKELWKICEYIFMALARYYRNVLLEGLRKTTKTPSQDGHCTAREHKSRAIPVHQPV
jgi:hypothetical protein